MSKVLLERHEFNEIAEIMEKFKAVNYLEIEVESVSGIGKVTTLTIPNSVDGISGQFVITITDENDW